VAGGKFAALRPFVCLLTHVDKTRDRRHTLAAVLFPLILATQQSISPPARPNPIRSPVPYWAGGGYGEWDGNGVDPFRKVD
jgi:hypothetical protein